MSSRRLAVLFIASMLVATGLGSAIAGCSTDDTKVAAGDSGADATPEATRSPPPPDEASTPKTCRELCEEAHPTALPKDEAVNSCWEMNCSGPCIEETTTPTDGGTDGDGGADAGACLSPVVTISESCDQCTILRCCAAWDGCFQDPECSALNACYQKCVN